MFEKAWESSIYSQNRHINRYPFGEVVSQFFNAQQFLSSSVPKSERKVLELGCGAGNNAWFFAENGFPTSAVDGSESAIALAKNTANQRQVEVDFQQAFFHQLPFEDQQFSIIVDRAATYCGTFAERKIWWQEASRVLKPGGVVICFSFHHDCEWGVKARTEAGFARQVEGNAWTDFKYGAFEHTGIAHLATQEEMLELFSFCDTKRLLRHRCTVVEGLQDYCYDEWIYVGVKR